MSNNINMNDYISVDESAELLEVSKKYTFFPWNAQKNVKAELIAKAKGVYFYTATGKKFLDFASQLINMNIGHGNPRVANAVAKQMNDLDFVCPALFTTKVRGEVGRKIAEIAPGNLTKTFFTLGGAEAIENAMKIARWFTGKQKILTQYRSYHGATLASITAGGDPRNQAVYQNAMPNIVHFEGPFPYRCPWNGKTEEESCNLALQHLERVIQFEGPQTIAAIILEGESGTSGCLNIPKGYWQGVKALTEKYNILAIADEVMSGFCRTGNWFGIENHNVVPDMMVFAKGITAGYLPLGGVVVSEKIAAYFDDKPLVSGLTHYAHPVCLAAANEVLDIYKDDNILDNVRQIRNYVEDKVSDMAMKHPSIGIFRNRGLLGCIELVKNRENKDPMAPWNATAAQMEIMGKVSAKIREAGVYAMVRWNWIFIAPPLTVNKEQIDEGMDAIAKGIAIADEYCY